MPSHIENAIDLVFPRCRRPLPSPGQVKRILSLPLVQMFVAGRSGSVLFHSLLDSHPQVLDIPHIFKFYDFALAPGGLVCGEDLGPRFARFGQHLRFFDSAHSMHLGGRLGPDMRHRVVVEPEAFCRAVSHCLAECSRAGAEMGGRTLFFCIVTAYNWCLGRDLDSVRVVFQHLHHGDWLLPELLIERINLTGAGPDFDPAAVLRADRYAVTVRNPYQAFSSVCVYARQASRDADEERGRCEMYLRLLLQDWLRLEVMLKRVPDAIDVIKFEDLHFGLSAVLETFCAFAGISPREGALERSTFYGLDWHGDIYTAPKTSVGKGACPSREEYWQDNALITHALGALAARWGYVPSAPEGAGIENTLVHLSPRLVSGGALAAPALAAARLEFASAINEIVKERAGL